MEYQKIFKNPKDFILLIPSYYSWTIVGIFVLFNVFDLIHYIDNNNLDLIGNSFILLAFWAFPIAVTGSFTGMLIDYYPSSLRKLVIISLLGSSLSLLVNMLSLFYLNDILMLLSVFSFGFFTGILIISGQTLYSISIPQQSRGRGYAIVIGSFLITTFICIIFFDNIISEGSFFGPLIFVSLLGIILTGIFYYYSKEYDMEWINDEWPTKLMKILSRPSVIVYFWTHTLIWIMLGLMIGSLARFGEQTRFVIFQEFFNLSPYKSFWLVVCEGSLVFILISGYLSDLIGRKSVIILALTGIVLSSLIIGIFDSNIAFVVSTFIIGVSFACVHTTLDSSLWVDLATQDSIGRYNSLNIQSLGLGLFTGFIISFFFYQNLFSDYLKINIIILLGLTVFASLPLSWVSDSYPPLEFFLLLVTNKAGIPLFHYDFRTDDSLDVNLPLISGALTALSSFMIEATGEKQGRLSLVQHGTHYIISDESEIGIKVAIFSNKNDPELQKLLKDFLIRFQTKFEVTLKDWKGEVNAFSDANNDAEEIFGHLITIKT